MARTPKTVTDPAALTTMLRTIKDRGYAIVDQELEIGLRSIAVPICNRGGTLLGAINLGVQSARATLDQLVADYLPALQRLSADIGKQGLG